MPDPKSVLAELRAVLLVKAREHVNQIRKHDERETLHREQGKRHRKQLVAHLAKVNRMLRKEGKKPVTMKEAMEAK